MRTEAQIRHQIKQVAYRALKKRIRTSVSRRPVNCAFNEAQGPYRFCTNAKRAGILCDETYGDGASLCASCPFFQPSVTVDGVRAEFREWLSGATLADIATQEPDMAALMWVLGDTNFLATASIPPQEQEPVGPSPTAEAGPVENPDPTSTDPGSQEEGQDPVPDPVETPTDPDTDDNGGDGDDPDSSAPCEKCADSNLAPDPCVVPVDPAMAFPMINPAFHPLLDGRRLGFFSRWADRFRRLFSFLF